MLAWIKASGVSDRHNLPPMAEFLFLNLIFCQSNNHSVNLSFKKEDIRLGITLVKSLSKLKLELNF